jgi:LysM repeat protein
MMRYIILITLAALFDLCNPVFSAATSSAQALSTSSNQNRTILSEKHTLSGQTSTKQVQASPETKPSLCLGQLPHPGSKHDNQEGLNILSPLFHVVKKGESIKSVAKLYGVPAELIRHWNKLKGNKLPVGKRIYVGNPRLIEKFSMSKAEKISLIKTVAEESSVAWEVLYAVFKVESNLRVDVISSDGRFWGWAQIYRHVHGLSPEEVLDPELSARFAADLLVRLGYHQSVRKALEKYNASSKKQVYARKVLHIAKAAGFSQ